VAAGHAVIADAMFLNAADRAAVALAAGPAHFLGVWLRAPLAVLEARVAHRGADASDADVAVLRRVERFDTGASGWLAVDATDAASALGAVRRALSAHP
jgi:predicted kinase